MAATNTCAAGQGFDADACVDCAAGKFANFQGFEQSCAKTLDSALVTTGVVDCSAGSVTRKSHAENENMEIFISPKTTPAGGPYRIEIWFTELVLDAPVADSNFKLVGGDSITLLGCTGSFSTCGTGGYEYTDIPGRLTPLLGWPANAVHFFSTTPTVKLSWKSDAVSNTQTGR